jgi:hypothetical protein
VFFFFFFLISERKRGTSVIIIFKIKSIFYYCCLEADRNLSLNDRNSSSTDQYYLGNLDVLRRRRKKERKIKSERKLSHLLDDKQYFQIQTALMALSLHVINLSI